MHDMQERKLQGVKMQVLLAHRILCRNFFLTIYLLSCTMAMQCERAFTCIRVSYPFSETNFQDFSYWFFLDSKIHTNPFATKIRMLILLTVCHTFHFSQDHAMFTSRALTLKFITLNHTYLFIKGLTPRFIEIVEAWIFMAHYKTWCKCLFL